MLRATSSRSGIGRHRRERRASDSSGSPSDAESDYYDEQAISPGVTDTQSAQAKKNDPGEPSSGGQHSPPNGRQAGHLEAHACQSTPAIASASSVALGSTHSLGASSRFRSSAQRLIRLRRLAAASQPGAEPGVDAERDSSEYDHIKADCQIDVIDYGQEHSRLREFDNKGFLQFLATAGKQKDDWAKVRWINVKGMDWSIIKALSMIYQLHPLALEDVLHSRDCRSKVDYYRDQLFVQGLALLLVDQDDSSDDVDVDGAVVGNEFDVPLHSEPPNGAARSEASLSHTAVTSGHANDSVGRSWLGKRLLGTGAQQPTPQDLEAGRSPYGRTHLSPQNGTSEAGPSRNANGKSLPVLGSRQRKVKLAKQNIDRLRGEKRVKVRERNMYIFMFRDGTLITLHESKNSVNDTAIKERLKTPNTLLRGTAEVSVLLHGLLDLMVDHAIQVVDAFQDQILYLEQETLLRPQMDWVKLLHMLSADITLHKRALKPLQSLVYGMRRYDQDRCIAIAASVNGAPPDPSKVKGFLSHQAKVYLADVHDHLEYVIASLEMFETVTENLISYSFNVLSYDMNEIMRRLTLATLIFFPLTFLSGYFGMNFTKFSSIEGSDLLFWKIALPAMAGLILMFCWSDVVRAFKYVSAARVLPQSFQRTARTRLRIGRGGSILRNHRSGA